MQTNKMEKEIRSRTIPATENNTIEGYALNWNEYDMGSFMERIDVNALGELRDYDVHALYNHDYDRVLARSKYGEGTLSLEQDQEGLKFRFDLSRYVNWQRGPHLSRSRRRRPGKLGFHR